VQEPASEQALVRAVAEGDREAFATVFRHWYPPIVRFVRRYVRRIDVAEDIAQDVFIAVWERRSDLDPSRSFRAYLYTIARNRALNVVAHNRLVSAVTVEADDTRDGIPITTVAATSEPGPAETVEFSELIRIAESRVMTLSPRLREIYHLTRHEGLAPAEVAQVLGSSIQTVYKQIAQIVKALHPILDRWRRT